MSNQDGINTYDCFRERCALWTKRGYGLKK